MELQVNQQYEFEVIDICSNTNGLDYLLVLCPDDKTYKVYNIIKCQYTSIPTTIYGLVAGTDTKGNFRIKQDECRVLQEHYDIGHFYAFKISDKRQDNNNKTYYVLEDDFSYQRWYSNEDYEIGDDIILLAKSVSHFSPTKITSSGRTYLSYSTARYTSQFLVKSSVIGKYSFKISSIY